MDTILSLGFASYFLITADFIQWGRDQDIPVGPGRGSAAGSLVAYVLGITDICPIRFGLGVFGDRWSLIIIRDMMFRDYDDSASYQYAQIYAQWGETDLALTWLENAVEIRDVGVILTKVDRLLDPLRDEPRFQAVLEAIGY